MNNKDILYKQVHAILLSTYHDGGPLPSENAIRTRAREFRSLFKTMYPVTDREFEYICQDLLEHFQHSLGDGSMLADAARDTGHQYGWYRRAASGRRFFWERYSRYLNDLGLRSPNELSGLDRLTDDIMDQLGDPTADRPFQRRGLLMGDVQSGKTSVFNAICCKAVDAGYRVVIVLSGISEILRRQTQVRLDYELVGEICEFPPKSGRHGGSRSVIRKLVGAGITKVPDIPDEEHGSITPFTFADHDFDARVLKTNHLNLDNLRGAALFVVKKNAAILKNLREWLEKDRQDQDVPESRWALLLIDDEADNASVNTNKPDQDPTAINNEINLILRNFRQASYLGVTATPFANIFIDPSYAEDGAAADLFPRDFLMLLPAPDHYIGPSRLFGADDGVDDGAQVGSICSDTLIAITNDEMDEYIPPTHDKTFAPAQLPPSLQKAIRCFLLATAVGDSRGHDRRHRSMLVNVSRFTMVQNLVAELVNDYVHTLRSAIDSYAALPAERIAGIPEMDDLRATWDEFVMALDVGVSWPELLAKYLRPAAVRIEVHAVNQSSRSLNYQDYAEHGLRVVAVGGNALSRGFTLEGLIVSYFYRRTNMYDTLLQMGRWFGYRPGYEDLLRIWMGEDAIGWCDEITQAVEELKTDLRTMARDKRTPADFGHKIRSSEGSLMVTARNKMRGARRIAVPITISGRMIETARLWYDPKKIHANNELCENFIATLRSRHDAGHHSDEDEGGASIWHGVSAQAVAELVGRYQCHPWNLSFQSEALSKLIGEDEEWWQWDVGLPWGSGGEYTLNLPAGEVMRFRPQIRTLHVDQSYGQGMLRVYGKKLRIGSRYCARIGLDATTIAELERQAQAQGNAISNRTYITKDRRPLLLLHLMENKAWQSESFAGFDRCIWALGLVFPGGRKERTAVYDANKIWFDQFADDIDDAWDDED